MKIKFLIISALLLCAMRVSAQYKEIVLGLKMGPSWNWMSSSQETTVNRQTLVSFNYGLFVDKYLNDRFAISSGLMMNNIRGNYDFHDKRSVLEGVMPEYEVNVHRNLKASYLCVPLMLKVKELVEGSRKRTEFVTYAVVSVLMSGDYEHRDELMEELQKNMKELQDRDIPFYEKYSVAAGLFAFLQATCCFQKALIL